MAATSYRLDDDLKRRLAERLIRAAVNFAAAYPDEIEQRIALNDAAAERTGRLAEQRARLLAS